MTAPDVRRLAQDAQLLALDPAANVWVSASAGSGKTTVLTHRVLRLLLSGVEASKILCVTYTKAATSEMDNRIRKALAKWAVADDGALEKALSELFAKDDTPDFATLLPRARSLLTRVLDVPGGLKIVTLHAFCQSLLSRFPAEAGVAPHFELIDENAQRLLLHEAIDDVLAGRDAVDPQTSDWLDTLVAKRADMSLLGDLESLVASAHFATFLRGEVDQDKLADVLAAFMRHDLAQSEDSLLAAAVDLKSLDQVGLHRMADLMARQGNENEQQRAEKIFYWLNGDEETRKAFFQDYAAIFTNADATKVQPLGRVITKPTLAHDPGLAEVAADESRRLLCARQALRSLESFSLNFALLMLCRAVFAAYQRRKDRIAALDYNDLIYGSLKMLDSAHMVPWVLFKLDGALDHVLLDEAQDTNPDQWRILWSFVSEYFSGLGAKPDETRSLFVVGDEKQSIYRFQSADPWLFDHYRQEARALVEAAGKPWRQVPLPVSFRSSRAILDLVDAVFADKDVAAGVSFSPDPMRHDAVRAEAPGRVELWPLPEADSKEELEPWQAPLAPSGGVSSIGLIAGFIAARIKTATQGQADGKKATRRSPKDFMILLRARGPMMTAIVAALTKAGVPVAGVDRIEIFAHPAVADLLAIARLGLDPLDDLSLAEVLKGPLVGLSEERLFEVCHARKGALLNEIEKQEPDLAARIATWQDRAQKLRPFEFFQLLLTQEEGFLDLRARFGLQAVEPVQDFLAQCLDYERDLSSDLQSFMRWITGAQREQKRETQTGRDEVRVMTVHGAKGLEAPVVILADATRDIRHKESLLRMRGEPFPLWNFGGFSATSDLVEAEVQRDRSEYEADERRLLYVAMTRAEDELYVIGKPRSGPKPFTEKSWYHFIQQGFARLEGVEAYDFQDRFGDDAWPGEALVYQLGEEEALGEEQKPASEVQTLKLPAWLHTAAKPERLPPRPLSPSRLADADTPVAAPFAARSPGRFHRGLVVHRLLEAAPAITPDRRPQVMADYLARALPELSDEQRTDTLREVLTLLDDPETGEIFTGAGFSEVPVTGLIGDEVVSASIDRLLVEGNRVRIVDFKSNRPPPADLDSLDPAYLRQMALYVKLVEKLYKNKEIEAFLLWTYGPRLMRIPQALLADVLA